MGEGYITGIQKTSMMEVPAVSTNLDLADHLGSVMVRWNINRNNYRVNPGLYAVGRPTQESDVFVTANYKLTFDILRKDLEGINGWILVLDTHGINVWCAAGKGTFGTKELIRKIKDCSLENIISHRRLIVPQLGATGIAAHKVKEETGFNVMYGPVRSRDVKKFVENGYRKDKQMTRVTFNFKDRIKLVPNDFIYGKYYILGAIALMVLLSFITPYGFIPKVTQGSSAAALNTFLAYVGGIVITPALLPYIPSRAFALKGLYTGIILYIIILLFNSAGSNMVEKISWLLLMGTISSFMAMNFTGSSTYTSLSGVKKEMKIAVPVQIVCAATGITLYIIGKLI